jgi:hypothetical protein
MHCIDYNLEIQTMPMGLFLFPVLLNLAANGMTDNKLLKA